MTITAEQYNSSMKNLLEFVPIIIVSLMEGVRVFIDLIYSFLKEGNYPPQIRILVNWGMFVFLLIAAIIFLSIQSFKDRNILLWKQFLTSLGVTIVYIAGILFDTYELVLPSYMIRIFIAIVVVGLASFKREVKYHTFNIEPWGNLKSYTCNPNAFQTDKHKPSHLPKSQFMNAFFKAGVLATYIGPNNLNIILGQVQGTLTPIVGSNYTIYPYNNQNPPLMMLFGSNAYPSFILEEKKGFKLLIGIDAVNQRIICGLYNLYVLTEFEQKTVWLPNNINP